MKPLLQVTIIIWLIMFSGQVFSELTSSEIQSICESSESIVLIDTFKYLKPDFGYQQSAAKLGEIDVDGDGAPDVFHGDFVAKIFELNNRSLKTYGLKDYGINSVKGALGDLKYFIRTGKIEKPGAIVMAMSRSFSIDKIKTEILRDKNIDLTFDNINEYSSLIMQAVKEVYGDGHMLYSFYLDIQELKELGVPVIVAAGNDYSNAINMASLMGTVSLGATSHAGKVAAYSNQNTYVDIYRPGDFISRKVSGGVDINNDGKADFANDQLTRGKPIVEKYNNRSAEVINIEDVDKYLDDQFLILNRDYNIRYGVKSEKILTEIDITYGSVIHYPSNISFFKQSDGTLLFDPARDNSANQLTINYGTSFAIGNLCAR